MKRGLFLLLGLAVGFAAGYGVARIGGSERSEATPVPSESSSTAGRPSSPTPTSPALASSPREVAPAATAVPGPGDQTERAALDSGGAVVESEVARRAVLLRRQFLQSADQAETIARQQVLQDLRKERAMVADTARGGPLELLRRLDKDWVTPWETVLDADGFARFLEPRSKGARANAARVDASAPPADGDVIEFPPGVHAFDPGFLKRMERVPRDLVFDGRGMDETLVRFPGWNALSLPGDVHGITFRDLTLHLGDAPLEVTREGFTLRMQRCRVIGFDRGAGGSEMLSGGRGLFLATDCAFEAGWGNAPRFATLFRVHGPFLARVERTLIRGPLLGLGTSAQSAVVFAGCRFVDMEEERQSSFEERPTGGIRFVDCTFEHLPKGAEVRREARPLTDLNPAWGVPLPRR